MTAHRAKTQTVSACALAAILALVAPPACPVLAQELAGKASEAPGKDDARPSNLLLVTLDTVRADRLGCYGYRKIKTPSLDAVAARGVLFENAYTPAVLTLPAHATILTGLLPAAHGARDNAGYPVHPNTVTLAEILEKAGFRTGAVVGSLALDASFGLDQGIEIYDDVPDRGEGGSPPAERSAAEVTDAALSQLTRFQQERWFLWVHYRDPHAPHSPPPPYAERYAKRPYDGEIAYVDAEVGRLLAALASMGAEAETTVVIAGDHGEGFGDHGEQGHGVFLYDETTRVPLIIAGPAPSNGPRRVASVVRTTDILPTILDLFALPPHVRADGVSLRPLLEGRKKDLELGAFSESVLPLLQYGWSPMASLRVGRWKFIQAPRPELYDVQSDRAERKNRIASQKERAVSMQRRLEAAVEGPAGGGASAEDLARLRSLGYLDGGSASMDAISSDPSLILRGGEAGLPDPKDRLAILGRIARMDGLYAAAEFPSAVSEAQAILKDEPENQYARRRLADAYASQRRWDEAVSEYRTLLVSDPRNVDLLMSLGRILRRTGNLDQARTTYLSVLAVQPGYHKARFALGEIAEARGDYLRAEEDYRIALAQQPKNAGYIIALAGALERQGRTTEAGELFEQVAALRPEDPGPLMTLGRLFFSIREYRAALNVMEKVASMLPDEPEPQFRLGDCHYMIGDFARAEEAYRKGIAMAPASPLGYHGLGLVALKSGDASGARRWFEEALRVDPGFAAAAEELRKLSEGGSQGP